ncbi:MAG TPA: glycosyltransferase [Actinoplanes sp.]|nr:glycosyltransferase [Actinoplanes sp.]
MPPSPPTSPTVSVVIPAMNVFIPAMNMAGNLPLVLQGLPRVDEIIVVDGHTAGDTAAVIRQVRPDAVVVRQTRSGKGNALVCGFAASTGDIVITLNGDGSTDPGEIPRYVEALLAGAEVARGSRYRGGGADLHGRRLERIGNALLSRLVNALFGTRFTDLSPGCNAYWRGVLPVLDLPRADIPGLRRGRTVWGDGAEIELMIAIRTAAEGLRVAEVASVGYPPAHGARQPRLLRRAMLALRTLILEWRRLRAERRPPAPGRHDARNLAGYAQPAATARGKRLETTGAALPPAAGTVRAAVPGPAVYVAGERSTGRHAAHAGAEPSARHRAEPDAHQSPEPRAHHSPEPEAYHSPEPGAHHSPEPGAHHSPEPGAHHSPEPDAHLSPVISDDDPAAPSTAARRSGLYDTGVHRIGVYDSGVHRTDTYDSGVPHLPDGRINPLYRAGDQREVGGGRRRLDARDRRAAGRPDLTVIPGERSSPPDPAAAARDGSAPEQRRPPGHLRALPGERSTG